MAHVTREPTPAAGFIERITVQSRVVACDGGGGPLGHPRVWLRIIERETFCPYCSRTYVLADDFHEDDNH